MGNANVREGAQAEDPTAKGALDDPLEGATEVPPQQLQPQNVSHRASAYPQHHVGSPQSIDHTPSDSPGSSSPSPLLFTPQLPMPPITKPDEAELDLWKHDSQTCEQHQQDPGFPTLIQWSYGGNDVFVEGSWDNWRTRISLQRAGKDFFLVKVLPSGVYHYKFIVNGEWRYAPDLPWTYDEMGNVNNVLDVQDYIPENLESVAGFEPPRSPDASYDSMFPGPEDTSKEPALLPSHLHLTLLNVPPNNDGFEPLPRPQHVVLNHLYVEKGKPKRSLLALGLTHRFRSKYVTVVLYKPLRK